MSDVIVEVLERQRVLPVLTVGDADILPPLVEALIAAGVCALEITLRTAEALDHIRYVVQHHPQVWVGAGTVLSAHQWQAAEQAGARFFVSPCTTPALVACAQASAGFWLPGVQTASEIALARDQGFRLQKFFPAEAAGGARALASLAPVFPDVRFCPTGGVDARNWRDYLALAAVPFVAGSWLTPASLVATGDWAAITARVRAVCGPEYTLPETQPAGRE
ncbi:MAG: bifunctional 4-hydroxy-2-oxoglutarate aldolase/2-dehydro-3-deoxy-phosphogluconate aldolase [Gammaproteobacteria bacterium]